MNNQEYREEVKQYIVREKNRREIASTLERQGRELYKESQKPSWADKWIAFIYAPLKTNLDKYPLGHRIPQFGQGSKSKV